MYCIQCKIKLKSKKKNAKTCATCRAKTLPSIERICLHCLSDFIDKSRAKNKRYCSKRCNVDAGHARHKDKILRGEITKPIDKRDRREERRNRYNNDIEFKLSLILRTRLSVAIKNNQKTGSAVRDLGCSIEELRTHLENQFQEGMVWSNWTISGWHIDHIIPLSSFDLTNNEELKKACHYSNLQPLWAKDNLQKSDKVT